MNFYIDYAYLETFLGGNFFETLWNIFIRGGWIPFLFFAWQAFIFGWKQSRQNKFKAKWVFVMLAIDIPKANLQGPKAVESIFVALAGTRSGTDFLDKYWFGKVQEFFSWEIVSTEGYIQFFVRTPKHFRDVVEAAIYAQYPDANIRETVDYTEGAPDQFPSEEYEMWGSDIIPINNTAYPIKTYPFFEDQLSGELKDPMASVLEVMSRLGPGEQLWFQLILQPVGPDWKEAADKVVKKIIGVKAPVKKTSLDKLLDLPLQLIEQTGDVIFAREATAGKPAAPASPSNVPFLSPGEKNVLEAIQKKMSKVGYACKLRVVYLAKKEVYQPAKAVSGFLGAFSQFSSLDLNGFRPHATFRTIKFRVFVKRRLTAGQRKVMRAYKTRALEGGGAPYILNVEELATVYHFPVSTETSKTHSVKKIDAKRAEAPFSLPIESKFDRSPLVNASQAPKPAENMGGKRTDVHAPSASKRKMPQGSGAPVDILFGPEGDVQITEPKIGSKAKQNQSESGGKNPPNNLPI